MIPQGIRSGRIPLICVSWMAAAAAVFLATEALLNVDRKNSAGVALILASDAALGLYVANRKPRRPSSGPSPS